MCRHLAHLPTTNHSNIMPNQHNDVSAVPEQVGEALREVFAEGVLKRGDVFITSKLWNSDHGNVERAARTSMQALQVRDQHK